MSKFIIGLVTAHPKTALWVAAGIGAAVAWFVRGWF